MRQSAIDLLLLASAIAMPSCAIAQEGECKNKLEELVEVVTKFSPNGLTKKELNAVERAALISQRQAWRDLVPGLSSIYETGHPRLSTPSAERLGVTIHVDGKKVMLVEINFPVVNLPKEQQHKSLEALVEITDACIRAAPNTKEWLSSALGDSWDRTAKRMMGDKTVETNIIQSVFSNSRIAVWGVPPDMWQVLLLP